MAVEVLASRLAWSYLAAMPSSAVSSGSYEGYKWQRS